MKRDNKHVHTENKWFYFQYLVPEIWKNFCAYLIAVLADNKFCFGK